MGNYAPLHRKSRGPYNQELEKIELQESSMLNQKLKNILIYASSVASIIGTGLAFKQEIATCLRYESKKLDGRYCYKKALVEKNKICYADETISKLNNVKTELELFEYKKYGVGILNLRIDNHFNDLQNNTKSLLFKALELQGVINNPDLSINEKVSRLRDFDTATFIYNRNLGDFKKLSESLHCALNLESQSTPSVSTISPGSQDDSGDKLAELATCLRYEIKKSSIINWDWFETLNTWEKLAISLLLTKSVVFSSLIGIIFVYYGDILLNKYKLEQKYPKIANIIKLRRKFTRYYFFLDCFLILGVVVLEVCFSLFILFTMNTNF